jgi:adenine/guanine phosphoribosyltransferase-like PRPP-binding protein
MQLVEGEVADEAGSREEMSMSEVWQELHPPKSLSAGVQPDGATFAVTLPDGRMLLLPIRELPGEAEHGVASLLVNQAAFEVLDALADAVTAALQPFGPEILVGVPTLGLTLAEAVARRLGHRRMVPLGTSAKFWYDEALSEPLRSITTPGGSRRVYLDPRLLPLFNDRPFAVVDDVVSTGASLRSVLTLLHRLGAAPVAVGAAMLQGQRYQSVLDEVALDLPVVAAFATPRLVRGPIGWEPEGEAKDQRA